jgi:hypothetical protein
MRFSFGGMTTAAHTANPAPPRSCSRIIFAGSSCRPFCASMTKVAAEAAREALARRVLLAGTNLFQSVDDRSKDHGHQLERTTLVWPAKR